MNKAHSVIWSKSKNAFVVVAEGTKACAKSGSSALKVIIALITLFPVAGMATTLPQGGTVTVGSGTIITNGSNEMVIKQNTDKLGINWDSFNVGADGHVIFEQPGASSIALNRVIGSDGSAILGKIDANGQVFLINPNGVIFGKDSKVNVGGLVASTLNISDADFEAGKYKLEAGAKNGDIFNLGTLEAAEGGYIALIGKTVKTQGLIRAQLGSAALAAGSAVTIDFTGDGLIKLQVDKSTVNALVENKGLIKADGGSVFMTARSSNSLTQAVVNNEGIIEAQTIGNRSGKIFLDGGMDDGAVRVAGTLDASAPVSGDGGFIETSGRTVTVADNVKVTTLSSAGKTGKWLIDPTDFTITAGSGPLTSSGIGASTLVASLASTNVELQTASGGSENGDINVNSDVAWGTNTTLTLTADGTINLNADISVNGNSGGLVLNYSTTTYNITEGHSINLAGANTTYVENGDNVIILRTVDDLLKLNDSSNEWERFALANNIDASITSTWNGGLGYAPAVMDGTFYGHLNGLGHSITDLFINRPTESNVGLIGNMQYSKVSNLHVSGSVTGKDNVGMVVGASDGGYISNIVTTGTVTGQNNVGGIAGYLDSGNLNHVNSAVNVHGANKVGGVIGSVYSHGLKYLAATGNVSGYTNVGGLIGYQESGSLTYAYSQGDIDGDSTVGGLIGYSTSGGIDTSYSSGSVTARGDNAGGLVGDIYDAAIENSFSTASVTAQNYAGGLVGTADKIDLTSSYATGAVTGGSYIGGLIGHANNVYLDYTYATGHVSATDGAFGGLVADGDDLNVNESYWDTTLSGVTSSAAGVGYASLKDASIFANWDLALEGGSSSTWRMYDGLTGPLLRAFMGQATAAPGTSQSIVYDGNAVTADDLGINLGSISYGDSSWFFKPKADQVFVSATQDGQAIRNAGIYEVDSFYSTQFGYDITQSVKNTLEVEKAHLDIGAISSNKTYDGTTAADVTFSDSRFGSDDLAITGIGNFDSKNAGAGKDVNVTGITVTGADAGNYTWDSSVTTTATIDKAHLTVDAIANGKTYDGTTSTSASLTDDRVAGDDISLAYGSVDFSDKNAGAGKGVIVEGITVSGADAGNYDWNVSATSVADIDKAHLSIGASGIDKVYDGSTSADVNFSDDRIAGDDLVITSSGSSFADKNAGAGKTVSVNGISVTGADAGNYTWDASAVTTATISKALLSVTADAQNKTYDGTTSATTTLSDDRIGLDDLVISSTGSSFSDKNAGTGKTVTIDGITVTGADADNYAWSSSATTTADIGKAHLDVSASASDKTYDGSTVANVSLGDDRIAGDDISLSYGSADFETKNAGSGHLVTVDGITLSGADAGNYTWDSAVNTTATINKAVLTVSATASDKVYDGTNWADFMLSDDRVAGDDLTVVHTGGTFSDKNAGDGKTVTVNGLNVMGSDAENYTWSTVVTDTANIAKANLDITAVASGKVYDGSASASTTLNDNRITGDDLVISSSNYLFSDKNAGTGKVVTVDGITLSGADAANYAWNTLATTTADITKANLVITANGVNKTYDGTNTASVSLSDDRVAGDDLSITNGLANFSDKNAGDGKTILVDDITVSGADAMNYNWDVQVSTTADIAKANLTVSAVASDKVYDGLRDASASLSDNRIAGDNLLISSTDALFSDKNAGDGKSVTVGGITISGADAGNYVWNTTANATANISKAYLDVTAVANGKVYDGSKSATVTFVDDRVIGDDLTVSAASSQFSDKNAGSGKTVTSNGITLSGADAANYTFDSTLLSQADISKASLVIQADSVGKVAGAKDGSLIWSIQGGQLYGQDSLTGSLSRAAGEEAGTYAIGKGTLSAGANYDVTVIPGKFEITKPVISQEDAAEVKQVVSSITQATKPRESAVQSAEIQSPSLIGDYRLLNLGMKLPEDLIADGS